MTAYLKSLVAIAIMSCGCNAIVVDPLEAAGEDGGEISVLDPPEPEGEPDAIAMYMSKWTLPAPGPFFNVEIMVDTGPDDLVLFFGSQALECAQPVIQFTPGVELEVCEDQAFWQTIIVLPADRAHPGVVDLDDTSIFVYQAIWQPECGGGYGSMSGTRGKLEIVSLDASHVSVKLDLESESGWQDINGDYIASFCP